MNACILQLVITISASQCGCANTPKEPHSVASAIQTIIKVAEVKSDATFKKQMIGDGQRGDHIAPKSLRTAIGGEGLANCFFYQGAIYENGKIGLYWRSDNCRFVGKAADFRKRVLGHIKTMGFKQIQSPDKRFKLGFRRETSGVEEIALFDEFLDSDGRETAGTRFLWTVRSKMKVPMPTYLQVKAVMPVLYDKRINDSAYRIIRNAKLTRVEIGGTSTKYYHFRVDIHDFGNGNLSAAELHEEIVDRITSAGFSQTKRPRFSTWDKFVPSKTTRSTPIIQMKIENTPPLALFDIQPES